MTGVKANEDLVQLLSPKEFSTRCWGRRDRKGKVFKHEFRRSFLHLT
jgi:hypothetical protein